MAQVPLTVSPFVSLPTATTLPYTYKALPSTLPPSSTGPQGAGADGRPKYVVSSSGHAAHPADIMASCRALDAHLDKLQSGGQEALDRWQQEIEDFELAEKRKLAPGWLDRNEKILSPLRATTQHPGVSSQQSTSAVTPAAVASQDQVVAQDDAEGRELDRAFGSLRT